MGAYVCMLVISLCAQKMSNGSSQDISIKSNITSRVWFWAFALLSCCRPKLKNIDRSSAQQLAITVGNVTVIITDFKEKTRTSSTSSSTATSSSGSSEQQHLSSSSESTDRGWALASTPCRDLTSGHNELLWGCWKLRILKLKMHS